jgi:hypothetical protein
MCEQAGFEVQMKLSHEIAIAKVTDALKAEGSGVLTRIDIGHRRSFKTQSWQTNRIGLGCSSRKTAARVLSGRAR